MQSAQGPGSRVSAEQEVVEAQRVRDVLQLLDNLTRREEATIKQILNYLYDIGYPRLVNKKVPLWPLRRTLRVGAPLCKPAFRFLAWRWFKQNCPKLIADWLYTQVIFEPVDDSSETGSPVLIDVPPETLELPPVVEQQAAEILELRDRVNWLSLALGTTLTIIGIAAILH